MTLQFILTLESKIDSRAKSHNWIVVVFEINRRKNSKTLTRSQIRNSIFIRRIFRKAVTVSALYCVSSDIMKVSFHLSDSETTLYSLHPALFDSVHRWWLKCFQLTPQRPASRCWLTFGRESGFSYMDYSSFVWSYAQMSPQQWLRIGISVFLCAAPREKVLTIVIFSAVKMQKFLPASE